jgi:hypothetical protein
MTYPELIEDISLSPMLTNKLKQREYAQKFYAALCNTYWRKEGYDYYSSMPWSVSWRVAGAIVSGFYQGSDRLSDYMEFYCSGGEGLIDSEVEQDLYELGWQGEPIGFSY